MRRLALAALAAWCIALPAAAESPLAAEPACPAAEEITHVQLLGLWRASFDGLDQGATLSLQSHPELAESVRGTIDRAGDKALVAGDVGDGEFTLEESVDGVGISATWTGTVIDGSCGREIRGDWQAARDATARPFVLRKLP
jgi:hypothetical protein